LSHCVHILADEAGRGRSCFSQTKPDYFERSNLTAFWCLKTKLHASWHHKCRLFYVHVFTRLSFDVL